MKRRRKLLPAWVKTGGSVWYFTMTCSEYLPGVNWTAWVQLSGSGGSVLVLNKDFQKWMHHMDIFFCMKVCLCAESLADAPSSSLGCSDIFFSLTGVSEGPRNSSAHIAAPTSFLVSSLHPPLLSSQNSLHFFFFIPPHISRFLNLSLKQKTKKKWREETAVDKKKRKKKKESAPVRQSWANDIIEVFVLRYRNMLKRHHGQRRERFWRGRGCENVGGTGAASGVRLWMNVCDGSQRGSHYITLLGKCWMMKGPINNAVPVICGLQSRGSPYSDKRAEQQIETRGDFLQQSRNQNHSSGDINLPISDWSASGENVPLDKPMGVHSFCCFMKA